MASAVPASDPSPVPAGRAARGWRATLPRVPPPRRVELDGWSERGSFLAWIALSSVLLLAGIALNYTLTDGAWVLPEQTLYEEGNPFGDTEVQFLTSHPYDVLTATLFVGSTLILGLSLLRLPRGDPASAHYGFPRFAAWMSGHRHTVRAAGWTLFAFHWALTGMNFYHVEEGDWVNAGFSFVSVFVLTYFAYQEMVSRRLGEDNPSLRFAAGAVFIAATVWYAFLRVQPLSEWIIEVVAAQTAWLLGAFGQSVELGVDGRTGFVSAITYVDQPIPVRTVIIILACTAIQSMMIFVAAALAVAKADWGRRFTVIAVTVPVVYVLNLFRNVIIIWMWEGRSIERALGLSSEATFSLAHNWIGKGGSLIALVVIALFMFRVLPEVVHAVIGLLDLPRRRGPIERYVLKLRGRAEEPAPAAPEGA